MAVNHRDSTVLKPIDALKPYKERITFPRFLVNLVNS